MQKLFTKDEIYMFLSGKEFIVDHYDDMKFIISDDKWIVHVHDLLIQNGELLELFEQQEKLLKK